MKLHGIKFHTPTFHKGGRKYKIGDYAGVYVGVDGNGKLRGHWRSGWRQHYSTLSDDGTVPYAYDESVVGLLSPRNSARKVYDSTPGKAYR